MSTKVLNAPSHSTKWTWCGVGQGSAAVWGELVTAAEEDGYAPGGTPPADAPQAPPVPDSGVPPPEAAPMSRSKPGVLRRRLALKGKGA